MSDDPDKRAFDDAPDPDDPLLSLPPCPTIPNHRLLVSHGWEDGSSEWNDEVGVSLGKSPSGRRGFAVWRWDGVGFWSYEGTAEQVARMLDHVTLGRDRLPTDKCENCGTIRAEHGPRCVESDEDRRARELAGMPPEPDHGFVEPFQAMRDCARFDVEDLG